MFRILIDPKDMKDMAEAKRVAEELVSRVPGGATCIVQKIDDVDKKVLETSSLIKPAPQWQTADGEGKAE